MIKKNLPLKILFSSLWSVEGYPSYSFFLLKNNILGFCGRGGGKRHHSSAHQFMLEETSINNLWYHFSCRSWPSEAWSILLKSRYKCKTNPTGGMVTQSKAVTGGGGEGGSPPPPPGVLGEKSF